MNRTRLDLRVPKPLALMGATIISQGDCRFCGKPTDVLNIQYNGPVFTVPPQKGEEGGPTQQHGGNLPIMLHKDEVCDRLREAHSQPGRTGFADEKHGIYKLA